MRILFYLLLVISVFSEAQIEFEKSKPIYPEKKVNQPCDFGSIESLRDIKENVRPSFRKHKITRNKFRRYKYINMAAKPTHKDPVLQFGHKRSLSLTPIKSWKGINESSQGASPPDPSGAVGLSHYVQMVNTAMQVFDKNGNSLWGPTSLSSVFPGSSNDGDPIVLFDQFANRWFISQFQESGNKMLLAISKTSDPLGGWFYYDYSFDEFPDYPKFSIWKDGYYMTANTTVQNAVCFERDKMLKGDASARMIALTFPEIETNGFFSALPAHASGELLPQDPINFFYFQDDGWTDGDDRIKIWEMTVDWDNPFKSAIFLKQELDVASFNSEFDDDWNDIKQPGTAQKLDAVPGAFMFMAHHRSFASHNSITLCHSVDVDLSPSIQSAIRWYELHQKNGVWEINQQSTFGPDNDSRWLGSIALDRQGNIGLGYSVSSATTLPSIRFTGRKKEDILSQMTVSESTAFYGEGTQSGTNRYGDYSHMTLDPKDGLTFWYTGEFMGEYGWETGVFSFKIGDENDYDVSLIEVVSPKQGILSNTERVKVLLKNVGKNVLTDFNMSFTYNGIKNTEKFTDSIQPDDTVTFTFSQTIDLSSSGEHSITVFSEHKNDGDPLNDSLFNFIESPYDWDVGVTRILSPTSQAGLDSQVVAVEIKNYGIKSVEDIPVILKVNDLIILDTLKQNLQNGDLVNFNFTQKVDFSAVKTFAITAYTELANDQKNLNDTAKKSIQNYNCNPVSYCELGDKLTLVKFGSIDNMSDCNSAGYSDFTNQQTELYRGVSYDFIIENNESYHQLSLWIDFNDNKVFETEELIIKDKEYSYSDTFSVVIPDSAEIGLHLMRVRTNWNEPSSDPCVEFEFGETEDYSVVIVNPTYIEEILNLEFEIFNQSNAIRVTSLNKLEKKSSLELFNGTGQILYTNQFEKGRLLDELISVSNFASGLYYVKISNEEKSSVKQFLVR